MRRRGRPPKRIDAEFLLPILRALSEGPRRVRDIEVEGLTNYYMQRVVENGLAFYNIEKVEKGPGRPNRVYRLTEAGEEYLKIIGLQNAE